MFSFFKKKTTEPAAPASPTRSRLHSSAARAAETGSHRDERSRLADNPGSATGR